MLEIFQCHVCSPDLVVHYVEGYDSALLNMRGVRRYLLSATVALVWQRTSSQSTAIIRLSDANASEKVAILEV